MRPYIFLMGCLALLCSFVSLNAGSQINWLTNYEQAVNQSKSSNKPILLFFTGSDWCGWCKKIDQEVFNTADFANTAGDKFIFVKLDFPLSNPLPANLDAQNKELQKKFDVRGFPTIVLIDGNQQQIGVTGYRPGGGSSYANHLLKMTTDFSAYKQKIGVLHQQPLSSDELKGLYGKCRELSQREDLNKIISVGMKSSDPRFFLLERYRVLADEGLIHEPEAVGLKKQLVAVDPTNKYLTQYEIASIEFEAFSDEMDKENYSTELAVEPLVSYAEKYGKQDPEHLWRVQMIISQVFLDQNNLMDALKYAQASHLSAPASVKQDINVAIKNIQAQLDNNENIAQP